MIEIPYIEFTQPIGTFYLSTIKADKLGQLVLTTPRSAGNPDAIQRDESQKRINEIAKYCLDPDATFPTPIIISVFDKSRILIENNLLKIEDIDFIGEVIDGQHRLKGILKSGKSDQFILPVVFLFDLSEEEKAYIFSIINSKQTKVSTSLIYDLFALSRYRSPQKTCHEIARALNKREDSPFFNRLKMLGVKDRNQDEATLSQGTFITHLLTLISKNPDEDLLLSKTNGYFKQIKELPLRQYFVEDQDEIILKILLNLFNAIRDVFPELWENPKNNILWKSTGYAAIIKSFNLMYNIGEARQDLSKDFFIECFEVVKNKLKQENLFLTSEYFSSNAQQQNRLSLLINESLKSLIK